MDTLHAKVTYNLKVIQTVIVKDPDNVLKKNTHNISRHKTGIYIINTTQIDVKIDL